MTVSLSDEQHRTGRRRFVIWRTHWTRGIDLSAVCFGTLLWLVAAEIRI